MAAKFVNIDREMPLPDLPDWMNPITSFTYHRGGREARHLPGSRLGATMCNLERLFNLRIKIEVG